MQMEGSVSADKILSRRYHKKISELWHYCTISFNSAVAHHRPSKMAEMSQSSWSISSGAKIIWHKLTKNCYCMLWCHSGAVLYPLPHIPCETMWNGRNPGGMGRNGRNLVGIRVNSNLSPSKKKSQILSYFYLSRVESSAIQVKYLLSMGSF